MNQVENVILLLRDYQEVTPDLVQNLLSVDYYTARDIFRELVKLDILYDIHKEKLDEENFIAKVNKNKINEYLTN